MRTFCLLARALAYIEDNLENPLLPDEIAKGCHCSLSALQKTFRYALGLGMMDYAARRRLTMAARDLLSGRERVVDIAYKYQYRSPEVFSRAFSRLWGDTPRKFCRKWRFSGLYPRVEGVWKGEDGMTKKRVDVSELYEWLRDRADTYVLCFDIVGLVPINEISREAGDLAILESLRRIDAAAEEGMLVFRIGGDEFALATGLADARQAEAVARRVLAKNGETICWQEKGIPLSLRAGGVRLPGRGLRYAELFPMLENAARTAYAEQTELWMLP